MRRPLYEPPARTPGDVQLLAGLVIYALILAMLVGVAITYLIKAGG